MKWIHIVDLRDPSTPAFTEDQVRAAFERTFPGAPVERGDLEWASDLFNLFVDTDAVPYVAVTASDAGLALEGPADCPERLVAALGTLPLRSDLVIALDALQLGREFRALPVVPHCQVPAR